MRILSAILLIAFVGFIPVGILYAAYTVILTDLRVENLQIYKQVVTDEEGVTTTEVFLSMNYTLYNSNDDTKGMNMVYDLSTAQKTAIINFIKPFVQETATADGVNPPAWAE